MARTADDASTPVRLSLQGILAFLQRTNLSGVVLLAVALLPLWPFVHSAVVLALRDDRYLQIIIAPIITVFLIYSRREFIFKESQFSPRSGLPMVLASAGASFALAYWRPGNSSTLLLTGCTVVLLCLSTFFLCYGARSFRAALWPLSCLLLMIPLPPAMMDKISEGFQWGSAELSHLLFRLTGIPVFRQGMRFSLPGQDIEIARECSGIRSSLIFILVGMLVGNLYLRSGWRRLALTLATIPISITKNAVRIVSLTLLSIYVDPSFITGPIHHIYGGVLFFPVDLLLFIPTVLALRKSERDSPAG